MERDGKRYTIMVILKDKKFQCIIFKIEQAKYLIYGLKMDGVDLYVYI